MTILVVAKQSSRYWRCINQNFANCPSGTFKYNGEASLKKVSKAEWEKEGQCPNTVEIVDTAHGFRRNTFPIKVKPKAIQDE